MKEDHLEDLTEQELMLELRVSAWVFFKFISKTVSQKRKRFFNKMSILQ
jgi:hypothetical protein